METAVNQFVFLNPPGIIETVICAALFALVLYGSLRSTRYLAQAKQRAVIVSLHILSFVLILLILFNPAYRIENYKEEKKKLAVIADSSWSMNLSSGERGDFRDENLKDFINENRNFFSQLEQDFFVDYYAFNTDLISGSLEAIMSQQALGTRTDFQSALEYLVEKNNNGELDTAIIITDGEDKDISSERAEELIDKIDFPVNTISPVTQENIYDIWIDKIDSSEVSFLRYPFPVEVSIKSSTDEVIQIPVSLYEGDKLVAIKEAKIDQETKDAKLVFEVNPDSLGRKIYTVSMPSLSDEVIPENNERSFFTDVIINKIRVLHVGGRPSWDVKFLRKALKRNPNVDLVSFFILRDPTDLSFASERELSLIPFPVNEIFGKELSTFDVVIFQDFHFQPYGIFGFHLRNIQEYVSKDGGSFLMIGGSNSFNSGSYGRTSLSEILPVKLDYRPKTLSETISSQTYHPELTEVGKSHPITRIIPNTNENERHWNSMPELEGLNTVQGLKPSAMALLSTDDGQPVLAVDNIDNGKVAAFMSDSSWMWNFSQAQGGNVSPHYEKFWNRLFLWFVDDPELRDVKISTDKAIYSPGEIVKLDITSLSEDHIDENSSPVLVLPNGEKELIQIQRETEGSYIAEIVARVDGLHKISFVPKSSSEQFRELNKSETIFMVEPPSTEVVGPTANTEFLKKLSDESGARFITTDESPGKLKLDSSKKKTLIGYQTKKLWDNPFTFLVLIAMLSSEWLLRRRWGLK
ncbi:MAG: glutamine amidotransferase [Thermodesulfobacteriota bacterium]